MAVYIFSDLLSGATGLDKSLVMTANQLHRRGCPVTVINLVGRVDGTRFLMPMSPLDLGVRVRPLQCLPADGGRHLHENFRPVIKDLIPNLNRAFIRNSLLALLQLNGSLTKGDAVISTHPLQAEVYQHAIADDHRAVRTVMPIHGDYETRHAELRPMLLGARGVIDHIQVVSQGMAPDDVGDFGAERVTWVPNIHEPADIEPRPHSGINVVLVRSFLDAKTQLDAVRMIQRIDDPGVHLTLWGNCSTKSGRHVQEYVDAHGLHARVALRGIGDEYDIYGEADIVVIPSWSAGCGYALVEAAAHGSPVVTGRGVRRRSRVVATSAIPGDGFARRPGPRHQRCRRRRAPQRRRRHRPVHLAVRRVRLRHVHRQPGMRSFEPPYGCAEVFERLCRTEADAVLPEYEVGGFPIREFKLWRRDADIDTGGWCDPRPIEAALSDGLGFPLRLGNHLDRRTKKFLEEREFWTPVFDEPVAFARKPPDVREMLFPTSAGG